jgi:sugar/nucleoside kinase (ribokinase family)
MSLVSVGTVAFDKIETPFGVSDNIVGGAATYISLAASYFNESSNIVSVVGDDFPKSFIEIFERKGVNLEGLQVKKGEKSFYWSGKYHYDMNTRDTLVTDLNVLADFDPVIPESYQDCDFLMLGNLSPDVQMRVIEQIHKRPRLVVLDTMNFWMDNARNKLDQVISKVDVLTINDEEARQLSGEYSLVSASRKILKMGPKFLIIKKGEHGALLLHEDRMFYAPALPLEEVKDPTGAGDTFAGGFIGFLAKTKDISFENMKRAIIVGSAMASFTCEEFGTQRLVSLDKNEINHRIQRFVDLVDFKIV